jgi:nucleoid DNA-binding protein
MGLLQSNYDKARVYGWKELMKQIKIKANEKYPNEHIIDSNSTAVLKAFSEVLEDLLGKGYKVRIGNLGFFSTTSVHSYKVGSSTMFPDKPKDRKSYRKVTFKPSQVLRDRVNLQKFDKIRQLELIETDFKKLLRKGYSRQAAYDELEEKFSEDLFNEWKNKPMEIFQKNKENKSL